MKHDWQTLKTEYSKAVSFLRQPTGTLTGLREYNRHLKEVYDLSDNEFELMSKSLNTKLSSISDSNFVERYLMRYKDFTGELEAESRDISDQIESEAYQLQKAIDDEIDRAADEVLKEQERLVQEITKSLNKFKP
jgi:gas vesicle protein